MHVSLTPADAYVLLILLILGESAGIPLPGATALIAAGVLASSAKLSITGVCVTAFAAAVVGGNIGYLAGRTIGTRFLTRNGPFREYRLRALHAAETAIDRFGWVAVLSSRFVTGLRECTPVLSGSLRMRWKWFIPWNTIGAVAWVLTHALAGFFVGSAAGATRALAYLLIVKVAALVLFPIMLALRRLLHRRTAAKRLTAPTDGSAIDPTGSCEGQPGRKPETPQQARLERVSRASETTQ